MNNYYLYLLIMAFVTYLVRLIPLLIFKEKIKNTFILSFLHYIPYAVLSAMTIPACLFATNSIYSGLAGLVVALLSAYKKQSLIKVALLASLAAFIVELLF